MASLVIKTLPDKIHKSLKSRAKENHRSMTQEAIVALENYCYAFESPSKPYTVADLPPLIKPLKPITNAMIQRAKRAGML